MSTEAVSFPQDVESLVLLRGACSRDASVRKQCLDTVSNALEKWLDDQQQQQQQQQRDRRANNAEQQQQRQQQRQTNGEEKNCNGDFTGDSDSGYLDIIQWNLPEIFRHAHTSPFRDVRDRCLALLQLLKVSDAFSILWKGHTNRVIDQR